MPSDIEVIQFFTAGGTLVKSFAAPFKIKAGSGMTFTASGSELSMAAAGGLPESAVTGVAGQVAIFNAEHSVIGYADVFYDPVTKILSLDSIQFSLIPTTPAAAEGKLVWNADDGTLNLGMPGGSVNLQIGQEMLVRVQNKTGTTIPNGKV